LTGGLQKEDIMEKATLRLSNLSCPDCADKISQILLKQNGVSKAAVFFTTGKLKVEWDAEQITLAQIEKTIKKAGYRVTERS
jgi:copper chaperone